MYNLDEKAAIRNDTHLHLTEHVLRFGILDHKRYSRYGWQISYVLLGT